MGLRHLVSVDLNNKVVGMITRKNLVHMEERAPLLNKITEDFDFSLNESNGISPSLSSASIDFE